MMEFQCSIKDETWNEADSMIKILFFIDSITGGGAEKVLRNLVNNMDQDKFDITVQTIDHASADKYLRKEIHYKSINRFQNPVLKKIYQYWIRLCAELKILYPLYIKDDYDIEVAYLECGPTKIISSSTNKKAVKIAWVHCDLEKKEGFVKSISKSKKYYKKFDKVVCVSQNVKQSFERLFGKEPESVVLYNVNDEREIIEKANLLSPFQRRSEGELLVAVGRLTRQKGFDRLIEACRMLQDEEYRFELWILGEGPERENLEMMIRKYHLENRITLWGFVENPYPCIKQADILVCSSRYEGLSTVVTEGLILGKAIVTTACTGMDELLGDSEYGVIVEDSIDGIYLGVQKLLDSKQLRIQYAESAKSNSKRNSMHSRAETTMLFLQKSFSEKLR